MIFLNVIFSIVLQNNSQKPLQLMMANELVPNCITYDINLVGNIWYLFCKLKSTAYVSLIFLSLIYFLRCFLNFIFFCVTFYRGFYRQFLVWWLLLVTSAGTILNTCCFLNFGEPKESLLPVFIMNFLPQHFIIMKIFYNNTDRLVQL